MHHKITKILDTLAINFLVYVISFVWLRYYIRSLTLCLLLALGITALGYLLFHLITYRTKDKKALKRREAQDAETYMNSLVLAPLQTAMDFLYSLFKCKYHTLIRKANTLLDVDLTVVPVLKLEKLTRQEVADAAKQALANGHKKLLIVTGSADKETIDFAQSLSPLETEVADCAALYRFMKRYNRFPEKVIEVKKRRMKLSEILSYAFNKKRARGYILTGLLLVATSFLTPFKLYYIVMGSVLLGLALFSLINTRFNDAEDTGGSMME